MAERSSANGESDAFVFLLSELAKSGEVIARPSSPEETQRIGEQAVTSFVRAGDNTANQESGAEMIPRGQEPTRRFLGTMVSRLSEPSIKSAKADHTIEFTQWHVTLGIDSLLSEDLAELASLFETDEDLVWQERALCTQTDPEAFFPEKGESTRHAKRICQGCEVRAECLEYALDNEERFGVWGGLSERERRKLVKNQRSR